MKSYRIYLILVLLVLASLACQALGGGARNTPAAPPASNTTSSESTQPPAATPDDNNNNTNNSVNTDFPMTADAYNVTQAGGSLIFYTKLSLEDAMKFYRDTYAAKGYTERKGLATVSGGTFSIVFDGDPSGKSVVVQSVDLGDGSRTISVRLEAIQ